MALAKGREPPEWYFEEPETGRCDQFYLRAFQNLSTERSVGMSLGPIPWSKRREYAREVGLDYSMIDSFVDVMGILDVEYLNWVADEQNRTKTMNKPSKAKR